MKRLLVLLGFAALLALPAQAQTVTVRPAGDLSSLVGLPFDVPIVADWTGRADKLGSFAVRISWNPVVLAFTGGSPGSFGQTELNRDSAAVGIIHLAGINPQGASGAVTLAIARFVPILQTNTTVQLQLSELYSSGPTFADVLPSAAPQNGLYCPARGYWGDPDQDRVVGSRDALIALSAAVGLDVSAFPESGLADVDGDAAVSAKDALVILSYAVGLDVSPFRVARVALGSCGTELATSYSVTPNGDTLVSTDVDVELHFELRASAAGAVRTLPDVFWRSSNPDVVAVLPGGLGVPLNPGVAVITGKSGRRDSATATIRVVARRTRHYVDATAVRSANRLGTAAHPYAQLHDAEDAVQAGDTIVVQPGRYEDGLVLGVAAVILGKPQGTAWPVIARSSSGIGLVMNGAGRSEVHAVRVEGFDTGVSFSVDTALSFSVDTALVDSLQLFAPVDGCASAGIEASVAALYIRRSTLVGDGQWGGCADGITATAQLVVVEDAVVSDFGDDGLDLSADSVVVRRSRIHDNYWNGVAVSPPVTGSVALVVDSTRLLRNYDEGIYGYGVRSAVVTHSVIDQLDYGDAIEVTGNGGAGYLKLVADSIRLDDRDWLVANGLDSVIVDSVRVTQADEGDFYNVRRIKVTNSSFKDLSSYGTAIDVSSGGVPGPQSVIEVDSVHVTGSPACYQCTDGINATNATAVINRLRAENLNDGVYHGDATLVVTNSVFTDVYRAVYANSYLTPRPRLEVRDVVMTRAYYGIQSYNMVTVVDRATLNGSVGDYEAIYTYGGGADTVRQSTITGYEYGVEIQDSTGYAANNTVLRPVDAAFYFYFYYGSAADTSVLVNNTVVCDAAGAENADGLDAYYGNYRVSGNSISGCTAGLYFYGNGQPRNAIVRGNTISIPSKANYGAVWIQGGYRAEVAQNLLTGGSPNSDGGIYLQPGPYARVDSNVVQQSVLWGLRALSVDSIYVRGNLIEDVAIPYNYSGVGAISISGSTYQLKVAQNTLRRIRGTGMWILQSAGLGDTATATVDSNAVSGADSAAVYLSSGLLTMRGNNIRNNASYGVRIPDCSGFTHQLHENAFQGNGLYAVTSECEDNVDATGNWWGVNSALPGTGGADSVFGTVDGSLPLAAEPSVPALAPPILAVLPTTTAIADATAARPARASEPERPVRGERPARLPKTPRVTKPAPAGTSGWQAQRAARGAEQDVQRTRRLEERAGIRARNDSLRAASEAARSDAERARAARVERRRASAEAGAAR